MGSVFGTLIASISAPEVGGIGGVGAVALVLGYAVGKFLEGRKKAKDESVAETTSRLDGEIAALKVASEETKVWKDRAERLEGEVGDLKTKLDEIKRAYESEKTELLTEIKGLRNTLLMAGDRAPASIIGLADTNRIAVLDRIDALEQTILTEIRASRESREL